MRKKWFALEVRIRRAKVSDAFRVCLLVRSLAPKSKAVARKRGFISFQEPLQTYVNCAKKCEWFFVATAGRELAGFVIAAKSNTAKALGLDLEGIREAEKLFPKSVLFFQIGVRRKFAGKGIASALYSRVFEEVGKALPAAFASVALKPLKNPASISFHEKMGFKKALVYREEYFGKRLQTILFEKTL